MLPSVMDIDLGKVLRLHGAITSALEAAPEGQAAVAGSALAMTYTRIRTEVRDIIPDEQAEEFDRIFPEQVPTGRSVGGQLMRQAEHFNQARTLLGSLAGWLDGFIREAHMHAEVAAYAAERIRQERGIGFKSSR